MNTSAKDSKARLFLTLVPAFAAAVCGLLPLGLLEIILPQFNNLYALLISVYAALFVSLCAAILGALFLRRAARQTTKSALLRALLFVVGLALTLHWQLYLNPVQIGPLLENAVYAPLAGVAGIILISWLPFVLLVKKIF